MNPFLNRRAFFGFLPALMIAALGIPLDARSAGLPSGFEQTLFVDGLHDPDAMEFAPDGRLFVAERVTGRVRVVKDGVLLAEPFLTVNTPPEAEGKREEAAQPGFQSDGLYHYGTYRSSGLRGVAFDPDFESNGFIYVYYMNDRPRVNRVSRFTANPFNPDVAAPGSEKALLDIPMHDQGAFDPVSDGGSHNGGALLFGGDGKLYVTVGDGWNPAPSVAPQDLSNLIGKTLRINKDGTVPQDNPFAGQPDARPEIWALGFRNPYTASRHPVSGAVYVNDVVWNKETVYELVRGGNYRHPSPEDHGIEQEPLYSGDGVIAGGTWCFSREFPEDYQGGYFISDWKGGVIRRMISREDRRVVPFATTVPRPTYLKMGPDGALYCLSTRYETLNGAVYRIEYTPSGIPGPPTAGGARVNRGLQALYRFNEGNGAIVHDVSGIGGALDLEILEPEKAAWLSGGGLALMEETRIVSIGPATKIHEACQFSNQLTVEAWIKPANVEQQGPARILTVSDGPQANDRNFSLNQGRFNEPAHNRAKWTARGSQASGVGDFSTSNGTADTALQHVVFTHDASAGEARIYVDGVQAAFTQALGAFADWKSDRRLTLGNENALVGSGRFWLGELHLTAVYGISLTSNEVAQNYQAGSNPPPELSIAWDSSDPNSSATLFWPLNARVFVLETSPSLMTPSWSLAPGKPSVEGTRNTFRIPNGAPEAFYRLRRQIE